MLYPCRTLLRFLLAIVCTTTIEGKVSRGTIELGKGAFFQFVGKFGYGLGSGRYNLSFRLREGPDVDELLRVRLNVFLDEVWEDVLPNATCDEKVDRASRTAMLNVGKTGEWTYPFKGACTQKVRPHIWYFFLSECQDRYNYVSTFLEYELKMIQADRSHFSYEIYQTVAWNWFALLFLTAFIVRYVVRCRDVINSVGGLHSVIWLLSIAIALQFAGQILHILYLRSYENNGIGIASLDLCSEVFFMLSQVVQTALLIVMAMGYTLLPMQSAQLNVVKWVALASLVFHVALVSFSKLQDESASKYHENEGSVGWMLLIARLSLFAWFAFATRASQQRGGLRLHGFFQQFGIAGAIYFLAYPLLFLVVQLFAPYLRHPILQIGLLLMQTASDVWLAELFLSRGTYFKVSALSSSLLPGEKAS